jgi:hypothetical protein
MKKDLRNREIRNMDPYKISYDILKSIKDQFEEIDFTKKVVKNKEIKKEYYEEVFIDICKNLGKYLPEGFPRIDKESKKKSLIV